MNLDKLTYAGNLCSLKDVAKSDRYSFVLADICDGDILNEIFSQFEPNVVIHLAAESHVDRSIKDPEAFVKTNILGTYQLLKTSHSYWSDIRSKADKSFRFHHVSTDEVFGDLDSKCDAWDETAAYSPSSPYSASKASSDHLVRAWNRTFGLPSIITNSSNNYGPFQFPEKFIPNMILNATVGGALTVYGDGLQIRDWLFVDDHARALVTAATLADDGETYNISANTQIRNIDLVMALCSLLEELKPNKPQGVKKYSDLITFVEDRPGHDVRYALNAEKIKRDLGWEPIETLDFGLRKTVKWYLNNSDWWKSENERNIFISEGNRF